MAVREIIFAVIDDRAVKYIAEGQGRRAAAAVGDHQVGAKLRLGPDRIIDRAALLEVLPVNPGPGDAVTGSMLGRKRHLVQFECLEHLRRRGRAAREALDEEAAPPAVAPGQLEAEPAELGG